MKKVAMICVMAVVWFGLTGVAQAVRPVMPSMVLPVKPFKPFVSISVKPDILDLGTIPLRGSLPAKLEAHIIANCPHQVRASFKPFTRQRGRISIRPKDMSIKINGVDVRVARRAVPIISSVKPTPPEGVDVPIDMTFRLANAVQYPAGSYQGTLTFTVMGGLN
ncbi:MAG: hypothetical protein ACE5NM_03620 [Sedimentisphaerales bacterium]